ncbi:hypothetical protein ACEPAH_2190 [Sanghuangporus vaninii]
MLRGFAGTFKAPLGARAVSSQEVIKRHSTEWSSRDLMKRANLLGKVDVQQWEGRGLDATPVTMLWFSGAGVHKSRDPIDHFTGRAFDAKGEAVWFFDKNYGYFTNAIHFYPDGLPEDYDNDRFEYIPSNNSNLVAWCTAYKWDIKTGKKTQN